MAGAADMTEQGPKAKARFCVVALGIWLGALGVPQAQTPDPDWRPESDYEGKFDWIQMTSGEWLKGEIISMYEESLEFDSDEFDDLTLDWDDIRQIHTSQVISVGFQDGTSAVGLLVVEGERVMIVGQDETQEFRRADVLTITAGSPKEINFWSMKLFFGLVLRSGNSNVREVTNQGNIVRRTLKNRTTIDLIGNENTTEGVQTSDNQRATVSWDRFVNRRLFLKPVFGEYFRDPFQNVASRVTLGVGAGYHIIRRSKVEWRISGGPAYQETRFESVDPGTQERQSTPALVVGNTASWDITKWLEFDGDYRFQVVNEESGTYNHHLVASFETDITKWIDFDVSWIWDRIEDPTPAADKTVPEQDDFRTTVGLTFEF
jgi:putative salt-induced outer membrane protein YdiY